MAMMSVLTTLGVRRSSNQITGSAMHPPRPQIERVYPFNSTLKNITDSIKDFPAIIEDPKIIDVPPIIPEPEGKNFPFKIELIELILDKLEMDLDGFR